MNMKNIKTAVIKIESSKVLDQYFKLVKKLGEGTFGVVMSVIDKRDGSNWAIKKVVKSRKFKGIKKSWEREFQILSKVQHPNIIQLKEMYETEHFAYLVLELCDGLNLARQLKMRKKFTDFESSHIIFQVSSALSYLHRRHIVHRDVKMENILLRFETNSNSKVSSVSTQDDNVVTTDQFKKTSSLFPVLVKLADFGLSVELKKMEETMIEFCGTPMYMAPEIIAGKSYSCQCDVWSLGIIMFQLLTGEVPFKSTRESNLFTEILNFSVQKLCSPYPISKGAIECLNRLLHQDPAYRFSTFELIINKWARQSMSSLDESTCSTNVLQLMKDYYALSRTTQTSNCVQE